MHRLQLRRCFFSQRVRGLSMNATSYQHLLRRLSPSIHSRNDWMTGVWMWKQAMLTSIIIIQVTIFSVLPLYNFTASHLLVITQNYFIFRCSVFMIVVTASLCLNSKLFHLFNTYKQFYRVLLWTRQCPVNRGLSGSPSGWPNVLNE